MLAISLVLIVVGALLLVLVHPADRGSAQLVKLGGGALIVAGVVLLVLFLAGVFDAADGDVDAGLAAPLLMLHTRLHGWAMRRIGFAPGVRVTPLDAARRHLGATLVLAALHPSWVGVWVASYLALPGDRFRDPARMLELEVIGVRGPGRVLARVETAEGRRYRGYRERAGGPDLVWPGEGVHEVDLRGWQRA